MLTVFKSLSMGQLQQLEQLLRHCMGWHDEHRKLRVESF